MTNLLLAMTDLLWVVIFVGGLAVLWLAIKATEWLTEYVKAKNRAVTEETELITEETEKEERELIRTLESKAIIEDFDLSSEKIPSNVKDALDNLDAKDLGDVLMRKMFGTEERDSKSIMATKSVFVKEPEKTVVAKNGGIMPVVAKKARGGLSKAEQKLYEKIKKGQ